MQGRGAGRPRRGSDPALPTASNRFNTKMTARAMTATARAWILSPCLAPRLAATAEQHRDKVAEAANFARELQTCPRTLVTPSYPRGPRQAIAPRSTRR